MMKRLLLPILALGLGFGLLTTLPSPAAEKTVVADKIAKLVTQLGSNEFDEREEAHKQLDAIGEPALEALRKAMSSEDTEVRRRAEELIQKIEQRTESTKVLQPTKVHLVYKDTPVAEAVADFRKKTGYNITLHDPENKLKDRKVTLDTGDTVFWTAFDKFCAAANLVEAKQEDLLPKQPQPGPNGQPGGPGVAPGNPGIQIEIQPVPVRPIRKTPVQPAQPAQPTEEQPQPKPANRQVQQLNTVEAPVADEVPQKAEPGQKPAVKPAQPAIQPAAPIARPAPQQFVQLEQGQIVLMDGKPKDAPTDYSSAIRVRAMEKNDMFGANEGQLVLGLQVSPEPKIVWQNLLNVTITKAVDDKDQTLAQGALDNQVVPPAPGINVAPARGIAIIRPGVGRAAYTSIHQEIPVYLKKGAKNSKTLKELTGVIQAQVLAPAKNVITTDDVFTSANKTFNGGEKGWIKVVEASRAENGQIRVKFEMQAPMDVVPVDVAPNAGMGGQGGIGGPALPRGALQVQVQPQVKLLPGRRPIANGASGLQAIDDKGTVIPVTVQQQYVQDANGAAHLEMTAIFQLTKEQKVAKLVYSGSRSVTVEVPFTLKDVTLP